MIVEPLDERVLILAPFGRDALLAQQTLTEPGIAVEVCDSIESLCSQAARGAGALLLTQEALTRASFEYLSRKLAEQPPWSDFPVILLVSRGAVTPLGTRLPAEVAERVNLTFVERPVRSSTIVATVQSALRARRRQYELREHLLARAAAETAERESRQIAEEAVRVRDEFLAAVAHDLKNPLGAIRGFAQLLRRRSRRMNGTLDPEFIEHIVSIEQVAERALEMMNELLDVARLEAGQRLELHPEPTDLVELAARLVTEHERASSEHRFEFRSDVPDLVGQWDGPRLERALRNLLSNAAKYSPSNATIRVRVAREADDALVHVTDDGIGIPTADLPHIFERFFRASNASAVSGTGLGLSGARQIAAQHGGTIDVASEEGRGSTFTLRLSLRPAEEREPDGVCTVS